MTALLVGRNEDLLQALNAALAQLGIKTGIARSCEQVRILLQEPIPPELVFTEAALPDGTWLTVAALTASATVPVSLIVVAEVLDYMLFIDALETGAADFMMPPFFAVNVGSVIRSVKQKAWSRSDEGIKRSTAA